MTTQNKTKSEPLLLTRENSRSVVENFSLTQDEQTIFPNFDLRKAADIIFADPVVNGAEKQFVDKCMEGSHHFVKRDTKKLDPSFYQRMEDDFGFRVKVLRSLFVQAFRYRQGFLECIRGGGTNEVVGLNVLDGKNIEPITEPNGDPIKFKWKIPNPKDKKKPEWTKDEIVWFKFYDSNEGWNQIDMKSLYQWVVLKSSIRKYVTWLWRTGQYRPIYNFKDKKGKIEEDFLAFLADNDSDPSKPFITKGDFQVMMARSMDETTSFIELLKYCDQQILINLRIPPIDAGIPDASGRSNADAQANNLSTTVSGQKQVIMDGVNNKLLHLLNRGNNLLLFAPNDRFQKKQILEEAQILQSIGFTNDALEEHFNNGGLYFESDMFKKEEEQNNSPEENPRDLDMMPSRTGEGEGDQYDNEGSGEESSTRDDQLLTRSEEDVQAAKFTKASRYNWEVIQDD